MKNEIKSKARIYVFDPNDEVRILRIRNDSTTSLEQLVVDRVSPPSEKDVIHSKARSVVEKLLAGSKDRIAETGCWEVWSGRNSEGGERDIDGKLWSEEKAVTWEGGVWKGGTWDDGGYNSGSSLGGAWKCGAWEGFLFHDRTWEHGRWRGRSVHGCTWKLTARVCPVSSAVESDARWSAVHFRLYLLPASC